MHNDKVNFGSVLDGRKFITKAALQKRPNVLHVPITDRDNRFAEHSSPGDYLQI